MCKEYTRYCGTSEIELGLCNCTVDNPLAKARGLSLRTGALTMFYLSFGNQNQKLSSFFENKWKEINYYVSDRQKISVS